jgi:hypothetical protein
MEGRLRGTRLAFWSVGELLTGALAKSRLAGAHRSTTFQSTEAPFRPPS